MDYQEIRHARNLTSLPYQSYPIYVIIHKILCLGRAL